MTFPPDNPSPEQLRTQFEEAYLTSIDGWEEIARQFCYREIPAQEHWIKAGDYCIDMCIILEGLLRVYYIDQSGNEVNQHFYQAGEVFAPISAIISQEPCQYYIQVLEPAKLMLADYNELHTIASDNAGWLKLEITMLQEVFIKNAKHEAQLLMGNAEQRFRWFCKEYPQLLERLPQYHVASFLGITPVSLSRLRKKLEGTDGD